MGDWGLGRAYAPEPRSDHNRRFVRLKSPGRGRPGPVAPSSVSVYHEGQKNPSISCMLRGIRNLTFALGSDEYSQHPSTPVTPIYDQ